jgi:F-type H+-transporting ATPase subunit epsilon
MPDSIELEVISSLETGFKATIKEVYIPAYFGEAGILEHHLPFMSILTIGEIYYKDTSDKKHSLYIDEGFIEVINNKVTIISDSVQRGENINLEEIESRLSQVNNIIKSSLKGEVTPEELDQALKEKKRLVIKQKIAKKIKS